jgi:hypothetical protein
VTFSTPHSLKTREEKLTIISQARSRALHRVDRLRRPHGDLLLALGGEALHQGLRAVGVELAVVIGPEVGRVDDADGQLVVGVVHGAVGLEDDVVGRRAAVHLEVDGLGGGRLSTRRDGEGRGSRESDEGSELGEMHFVWIRD